MGRVHETLKAVAVNLSAPAYYVKSVINGGFATTFYAAGCSFCTVGSSDAPDIASFPGPCPAFRRLQYVCATESSVCAWEQGYS